MRSRSAWKRAAGVARPIPLFLLTLQLSLFGSALPAEEQPTRPCGEEPQPSDPCPEEEPSPDRLPLHLEEVVVSANRMMSSSERIGSSVTVLGRQEIERRDQLTAADLLRTVPGLEVTATGGLGTVTSVRLRGGDASQALVLVDGVRANSTTTGDFDFAHLKADNIERIEVLRGPQATYGSEAVSGVISIVTRRGQRGFDGRLAMEAGSHGLRHYRLGVEGGRGPFDFTLSLADLETDGVSQRSVRLGNVEPDGYDNQTLSTRLGLAVAGDGRLDLVVRAAEGKSQVDGFFGDDLNASQETEALQAGLELTKDLAPFWSQTFRLGVARNQLLGLDPDSPFNTFDITSESSLLQLQSNVDLGESNVLAWGYDFERRTGRNVGAFDEEVDLQSLYVEDVASVGDRLFLTGALRYDDHSQFGDETTYRVTAAYLWQESDTRLHGSFGTGFRAPDFNELYFPFAGDPTLRPERSEGLDLGLEKWLLDRRLRFDVTYFAIDFEDLIDFDLVDFVFANLATARSEGVEALVELRIGARYLLTVGHTYNETEDRASGEQLARRPKNRTTLLLGFDPWSRVRGTLGLVSVRDRINSDGRPMDDYDRVDLTVQVEVGRRFEPYLRLQNLLDQDYEEVTGFTTPGRTAAVGLAVDF